MGKKKLGYFLVGGAAALWLYLYYQQKQGLAAGTVTSDQMLTISDYLFSPAGAVAAYGGYLLYKNR